jgi:hypothetical protein
MSVKISALTAGTTLSGTEQFEAVQGGSSVRLTAAQIKAYDNRATVSYRSVSNGFTETFGASDDVMILYNAGTIGSGTVVMPPSPLDGQTAHITAAMTVTNLTVNPNAGQTLLGAPTTISVSAPVAFVYRATGATWYRVV